MTWPALTTTILGVFIALLPLMTTTTKKDTGLACQAPTQILIKEVFFNCTGSSFIILAILGKIAQNKSGEVSNTVEKVVSKAM